MRALKGVGEYTAAAICSFAYGMPYAVVDGNVYRVLSRWLGIDTPIDSAEGKKLFVRVADELLDRERPGLYNQAYHGFWSFAVYSGSARLPVLSAKRFLCGAV